MAVRVAKPTDAPEIARVVNAAYRVEDFFIDGDRTDELAIRSHMGAEGACVLVVDAPGDATVLAGSVCVQVRGDVGYFGMLAVDPPFQGTGLGRLLVDATEDHGRKYGCSSMLIDVVNLRTELPGFYRMLGYADAGRIPFPDGHKLRPSAKGRVFMTLMTKPLAGE